MITQKNSMPMLQKYGSKGNQRGVCVCECVCLGGGGVHKVYPYLWQIHLMI